MRQRRFIRFLLPSIGIIGALVIMIAVPLTFAPNTAAAFPYIPPPEGDIGDYIVSTVNDLTSAFQAHYTTPFNPEDFIGQSFMVKDVIIPTTGLITKRVEFYDQRGELLRSDEVTTYLLASLIQFIPQDSSKWQNLKEDDVIDIIGVCAGTLQGYNNIIVFKDCQFLPADVAPLPLPGGPAPVTGY